MLKNIKIYLKDKGFNIKELDCEGDSILLFWNDGYKYLGRYYVIYAISANDEYMDIGYLIQNIENIEVGYIKQIYWESAVDDEIFSAVLAEIKQIRQYAVAQENAMYLDKEMKEQMLFDDVQTIIDKFQRV